MRRRLASALAAVGWLVVSSVVGLADDRPQGGGGGGGGGDDGAPREGAADRRPLPAWLEPLRTSSLFMPLEATGVLDFRARAPELDGRGTLVAIVDSAIDLAHPSLQVTTTGAPKIVDVRDFSEACVVEVEREVDPARDLAPDGTVESPAGGRVKVAGIPARRLRLGVLREEQAIFTAMPDLNRDTPEAPPGRPALGEPRPVPAPADVHDLFDVVLAEVDDPAAPGGTTWACYVDCDQDGDLAEEPPLRDYAERRDWRSFSSDGTTAFCVNVEPGGRRVRFLFPHDGHGTHVTAIAAGHDPTGVGFEGVAPGAQVIFLKIGGASSRGASATGDAMMRAIRHAAERGADVVNISYGGRDVIVDQDNFAAAFLQALIERHGTAVVFSAGNNGPGLATVNRWIAPADAIGVARVDLRESTAAQAGFTGLAEDVVSISSSRGPTEDGHRGVTVAAPGMAVTAVPLVFGGYDLKGGTSMAAPSVTGGVALLVGGARLRGTWPETRDLPAGAPHARLRVLKLALERGAVPLPGYSPLDQGSGLLDVDRAFAVLERVLGRRGREAAPAAEPRESGGGGAEGAGAGAGRGTGERRESLPLPLGEGRGEGGPDDGGRTEAGGPSTPPAPPPAPGPIGVGAGVLRGPAALLARGGAPQPIYRVECDAAYHRQPERPARGLVVRAGVRQVDRVRFFVRPEFPEGTPRAVRASTVGRFRLRSTVPWLKPSHGDRPALEGDASPPREYVWVPGEQGGAVAVTIDTAALAPGCHYGEVVATPVADGGAEDAVPAFVLPVTYVVPVSFPADRGHVFETTFDGLTAAAHRRIFLDVPAGATGLRVSLRSPDLHANALLYAFSPHGDELASVGIDPVRAPAAAPEDGRVAFLCEEGPGVYELVLVGRVSARGPFRATVRAEPVGVVPVPGDAFVFDGRDRRAEARLASPFGTIAGARLEAQATELVRARRDIDAPGQDAVEIPVVAPPGVSRVHLRFTLRDASFFRFRLAGLRARVQDERGRVVAGGILSRNALVPEEEEADVTIGIDAPGVYRVVVERMPMKEWFGFPAPGARIEPAWLADAPPLQFSVEERHVLERPLALEANGLRGLVPPLLAHRVVLKAPDAPTDRPFSYTGFVGVLRLRDGAGPVVEMPLRGGFPAPRSAASARRSWIDAREREIEDARTELAHAVADQVRYGRTRHDERAKRARAQLERLADRPDLHWLARGLAAEIDDAVAPGGPEAAEKARKAALEDRARLLRLAAFHARAGDARPYARAARAAHVDGRRDLGRRVRDARAALPGGRDPAPLGKAVKALQDARSADDRAAIAAALDRALSPLLERRPDRWFAPLDDLVRRRDDVARRTFDEGLGRYHRDPLEATLARLGLGARAETLDRLVNAAIATSAEAAPVLEGERPLLRLIAALAEEDGGGTDDKGGKDGDRGGEKEPPALEAGALEARLREAVAALGLDAAAVRLEITDLPEPAPAEDDEGQDEKKKDEKEKDEREKEKAEKEKKEKEKEKEKARKARPKPRAAAWVADRGTETEAADVRLVIRIAPGTPPRAFAPVLAEAAAEAWLLAALRTRATIDREWPDDPVAEGLRRAVVKRLAAALGADAPDEKGRRRAALALRRDALAVLLGARLAPGAPPDAAWGAAFSVVFGGRTPSPVLEERGYGLDETLLAGFEEALERLAANAAERAAAAALESGTKLPALLEQAGLVEGLAGDRGRRGALLLGPLAPPSGPAPTPAPARRELF